MLALQLAPGITLNTFSYSLTGPSSRMGSINVANSMAVSTLVGAVPAGMGYQVKVNDPYKGVELVRAYSDPSAGRHSLQIEINKRLYMDETTLQKTEGFHSLGNSISELLKEISKYIQKS